MILVFPFIFENRRSFDLILCFSARYSNGKMTGARVSKFAYGNMRNMALTPIELYW
jgi:hypothetical protein